jgi:hypothetical protein
MSTIMNSGNDNELLLSLQVRDIVTANKKKTMTSMLDAMLVQARWTVTVMQVLQYVRPILPGARG